MLCDRWRSPSVSLVSFVSCPSFDAAGLALQPPQGGFPRPSGFGSARRSASVLGCVTSTNETEGDIEININKCICTGRLTKDPELRQVSQELNVCQLRLAVEGMGRGREVGFINVSVFGKGERPPPSTSRRAGSSRSTGAEYGEWRPTEPNATTTRSSATSSS